MGEFKATDDDGKGSAMDYGYPCEALRYDAQADTWTLNADFDASWMMWHIETTQDTADLAAESWSPKPQSPRAHRTTESLPLVQLRDAEGNIRMEGVLSGDIPLVLQCSGARTVRLERLEIAGETCLYCPSEPLIPGQPYTAQGAGSFQANDASAAAIAEHSFIGAGAMIATNEGPQPVDWLRAGDMILTRDNGYQPILYLAQVTMPRDTKPADFPLCVPGETFGTGLPVRELTLTAGTQILLAAPQLELWFGEVEMFARVDQIGPDLRARISAKRQTLWAVVLPDPEVILAEGLWIGSAMATDSFLRLIPERARIQIAPIVSRTHTHAARACLKDWEAAMFSHKTAVEARVAAA